MTSAAGLGDWAYGAAIREAIEAATGRKCSIGALYTTIERLEAEGLLNSWMGEAVAPGVPQVLLCLYARLLR